MNKKIISFVCMAAMCLNYIVFAANDLDAESSKVYGVENEVDLTINLNIDDKNILGKAISLVENSDIWDVLTDDSEMNLNKALTEAKMAYENEDGISDAVTTLNSAVSEAEYIMTKSVLTGNPVSDDDKEEWYPESVQDEQSLNFAATPLVYSYSESSPEKIRTEDTDYMLSDGNLSSFKLTGVTDVDTVITYDLGDNLYITGVDVFSRLLCYTSRRRNIGGFKTEISTDGVEFKEIMSVSAKIAPDEGETSTETIRTRADFPAYQGRYVRITVWKDTLSAEGAGSEQYNLSEILIKGVKFSKGELKNDLYSLLEKYADTKSGLYTKASYDIFRQAFDDAETIYWNENSTIDEIKDAISSIKSAYSVLVPDTETKIISGNVSDTDEHYEGFVFDTLPNLTYTYTDTTNQEYRTNDPECKKLLLGNRISTEGTMVVWGKFNDTNPAEVIFNLGEECYITGVDVWEFYQNAEKRIDYIKIFVSDDGEEFTEVSQKVSPEISGAEKIVNVISQDFESQKCRYVKIEADFVKYQLVLGEVVLKGYRVPSETNAPYEIGVLKYEDENGARVTDLAGNGEIKVTGNVKSNLSEGKSAVVITAAYNENNDIIDWTWYEITTVAGENVAFENYLDLEGETAKEICTFVWDSLENGMAYSEIKKFGKL